MRFLILYLNDQITISTFFRASHKKIPIYPCRVSHLLFILCKCDIYVVENVFFRYAYIIILMVFVYVYYYRNIVVVLYQLFQMTSQFVAKCVIRPRDRRWRVALYLFLCRIALIEKCNTRNVEILMLWVRILCRRVLVRNLDMMTIIHLVSKTCLIGKYGIHTIRHIYIYIHIYIYVLQWISSAKQVQIECPPCMDAVICISHFH